METKQNIADRQFIVIDSNDEVGILGIVNYTDRPGCAVAIISEGGEFIVEPKFFMDVEEGELFAALLCLGKRVVPLTVELVEALEEY